MPLAKMYKPEPECLECLNAIQVASGIAEAELMAVLRGYRVIKGAGGYMKWSLVCDGSQWLLDLDDSKASYRVDKAMEYLGKYEVIVDYGHVPLICHYWSSS